MLHLLVLVTVGISFLVNILDHTNGWIFLAGTGLATLIVLADLVVKDMLRD